MSVSSAMDMANFTITQNFTITNGKPHQKSDHKIDHNDGNNRNRKNLLSKIKPSKGNR